MHLSERFLKREGRKLCSQPIKGTNRYSEEDNESAKIALAQSEKERAENVMIVDLVRNDFLELPLKAVLK